MFFGLSGMHQRRDLLRAVMEGVTYSLKDCLNILSGMGVQPAQMLAWRRRREESLLAADAGRCV